MRYKYHMYLMTFSVFFGILLFTGPIDAQFQDLSCPSCVHIPPEEIDLYKSLFPLIIWTDDTVFNHQSSILLEGYLRPQISPSPVTIVITNPIGNIVSIEQINPDPDGNFSMYINTASQLWSIDGDYIIKAQNGPERFFKTSVEVISLDLGQKSQCVLTDISVVADNGGVYCIPFVATGETTGVQGTLDTKTKTLTLDLRGKGIESITIQLPRNILDSQSSDNNDTDFVVLFNGVQIDYEEGDSTADYRLLTISYSPDRKAQIEIIGTSVIPEFGALAILILVTTITIALILSKKSNLVLLRS